MRPFCARPSARYVGLGDGPVGPGGAADQLESQWLVQAAQQRQAVAEGHRLDVDPVLIDQAVGGERVGEARSAEDDDVLARLTFELGDLLLCRSVADARCCTRRG